MKTGNFPDNPYTPEEIKNLTNMLGSSDAGEKIIDAARFYLLKLYIEQSEPKTIDELRAELKPLGKVARKAAKLLEELEPLLSKLTDSSMWARCAFQSGVQKNVLDQLPQFVESLHHFQTVANTIKGKAGSQNPADAARASIIRNLAGIFLEFTGDDRKITTEPDSGEGAGPLWEFIDACTCDLPGFKGENGVALVSFARRALSK